VSERGVHVRKTMAGWVVFDGVKARSQPYQNAYCAEQAAERLERERKSSCRPCLTCGELFRSEGRHNRMCRQCRRRSADDPAPIGVQSGLAR